MGKKFTSDKPTFDEIRARRQPRTQTVWVPLNGDILDNISRLEDEIRRAERADEREHREPQAPVLRDQLEGLRAEAAAAAVAFTFTELPRKQYRELIRAHPSDDKQLRWEEDTFAPALIAAASIEPHLSLDDATAIWEEWGEATCNVLFGAAIIVNEQQSKVPFGVTGTATTNGSGPRSTTAPPEESATASS